MSAGYELLKRAAERASARGRNVHEIEQDLRRAAIGARDRLRALGLSDAAIKRTIAAVLAEMLSAPPAKPRRRP